MVVVRQRVYKIAYALVGISPEQYGWARDEQREAFVSSVSEALGVCNPYNPGAPYSLVVDGNSLDKSVTFFMPPVVDSKGSLINLNWYGFGLRSPKSTGVLGRLFSRSSPVDKVLPRLETVLASPAIIQESDIFIDPSAPFSIDIRDFF